MYVSVDKGLSITPDQSCSCIKWTVANICTLSGCNQGYGDHGLLTEAMTQNLLMGDYTILHNKTLIFILMEHINCHIAAIFGQSW